MQTHWVLVALVLGGVWSSEGQSRTVSVVFETELGAITMEVDVARAPKTAENFLKYVDGKFFDVASSIAPCGQTTRSGTMSRSR